MSTTPAWVSELVSSIDGMDADKFASFMTKDGRFRYGSSEPVVGTEAIRAYVDQFFGMFKALRHELLGTWTYPDAVFVQGTVTYTSHEGAETTLPFVNCLKMRGTKVHEYLVYIDPTPLSG